MSIREAIEVLKQRRDWLTARIKAKDSIGWDTAWDVRERDATTIILEIEILKEPKSDP